MSILMHTGNAVANLLRHRYSSVTHRSLSQGQEFPYVCIDAFIHGAGHACVTCVLLFVYVCRCMEVTFQFHASACVHGD